MSCPGRGAELDRLFSGELEGLEALSLREHVNACALCRAYYDRLSHVASTMENRTVPAFAAEALEGRLMARLGVASRPSRPEAPVVALTALQRRRRWPQVVSLAAAAAIAAIVLPRIASRPQEGEFTARSGRGGRSAFALKAFCIREGRVSAETIPGGKLPCPAGGAVQLAVTSAEPVTVGVKVQTAAGEALEPGGAIQVPAGTDIALPVSIPSSADWLSAPATMMVTVRGRSGRSEDYQLTVAP
jgi:hypothetical protein